MASIYRVAERYLGNVKTTGRDSIRAACPFHVSKSSSRSFVMSMESGAWRCYSCQESGSLTWFLRKMGASRKEIDGMVKSLDLQSVPLHVKQRRREFEYAKKATLLPEYILGAYDRCPLALTEAGFDRDFLQDHDVGYDRINLRITFAIRDAFGRLAAISGRSTQFGQIPRYKVYESSDLHSVAEGYVPDARRHLYCYHRVYGRRYHAESGEVLEPILVVEGFKGCLWWRQMGFNNTVALMGDVASARQIRLLARLRGPYVVILDHEEGHTYPDKKGRAKAFYLAKTLSRYGRALIGQYEEESREGTSPDDVTKEQAMAIINNAITPGQFTMKYTKNRR